MANDYASEREAAGRSVPTDIWMVVAPHAPAGSMERVYRHLDHDDAGHRYGVATGLGYSTDREAGARLVARHDVEDNPRVRMAVDDALARLQGAAFATELT